MIHSLNLELGGREIQTPLKNRYCLQRFPTHSAKGVSVFFFIFLFIYLYNVYIYIYFKSERPNPERKMFKFQLSVAIKTWKKYKSRLEPFELQK